MMMIMDDNEDDDNGNGDGVGCVCALFELRSTGDMLMMMLTTI